MSNKQTKQDRAVSPVIGVILMVAITVILAAVIGTFVLDLGQSVGQTGPTASLTAEDADASLSTGNQFAIIQHSSGDEIDANNLKITVRFDGNSTLIDTWEGDSWSGTRFNSVTLNGNSLSTSDTISTGDVLTWDVNSMGSPGLASGEDYLITVLDTDTQNTIAEVVVKIN